MRKTCASLLITAAMIVGTYADISWFHSPAEGNPILDELGNPLPGNVANSRVAPHLQLIYDSLGDGPDAPVHDGNWDFGTGAAGDDVVVDTSWIGRGLFNPTQRDGFANPGAPFLDDVDGGVYYVRVWNVNGAMFDGGLTIDDPLGDIWYADSVSFTNPSDPEGEPPSFPTPFEFAPAANGTLATDIRLVPEPTMAGLMLLGLVGIRLFRRSSSTAAA